MRERNEKILKLLIREEQFIPIRSLAGELGVSEKTLRRDMGLLNRELETFGGVIESRAGVGIRLNLEQADREELFCRMAAWEEKTAERQSILWDRDSRRMDIALNLLLYTDEPAGLSDLAYRYYVSKTSIANDIKILSAYFSQHGLCLSRGRNGIWVEGKEGKIREALAGLIEFLLDTAPERGREKGVATDIMAALLDCFSEEDLSYVEKILRELEEREKYYFDEREYSRISVGLLVALYRIKGGFYEKEGVERGTVPEDKLFLLSEQIISELSELSGLEIPEGEKTALYQLLSSTHLPNAWGEEKRSEGRERKLAEAFGNDFIDAFSVIMEVNLREEAGLYQNILDHIELMLRRAKDNASARNPLAAQILDEYTGIINVCQIICWILTRKFGLPEISTDEICYLTLYIQGEIMEMEEQAQVLLVSNQQKGIVNLMRHKLLTRHSRWEITECSYYSFFEQEQEMFDFAVSTLALDRREREIPCAFVTPMLHGEDWKRIEAAFCSAKEYPLRYLEKLRGTLNDLRDIGCLIEAEAKQPPRLTGNRTVCMEIEGLRKIRYLYDYREGRENICRFWTDWETGNILAVGFEMGNWDFMLFASKLIFLLGSCKEEALREFAGELKCLKGGERSSEGEEAAEGG